MRAALLCITAVAALSFALEAWSHVAYFQSDTGHYLAIARGHTEESMLPFASRQLCPQIVRLLHSEFGLQVETGFLAVGVAALLVFAGVVFSLLVRSGAPRFLLTAVAGMFFWPQQFFGFLLPDLLYAALLAIFLLLLWRQKLLLAALMMLPLMVSRESTLLTLMCFLAAGWRRLRLAEVATAVISSAAGIAIVRHLARNARPNAEHISPMLYLVAKMPWNFVKNVLGVHLDSNLYHGCAAPSPNLNLHLGPLHTLGYCGLELVPPLQLVIFSLGSFGLLPLLALVVAWRWRQARRLGAPPLTTGGRPDMLLRFAVLYGAVSYLLAPLLGESFLRLFQYSWPIFLVTLPLVMAALRINFTSFARAAAFLALHLFASWVIVVYLRWMGEVAIALVLSWLAGAGLLAQGLRTTGPAPAFTVPVDATI